VAETGGVPEGADAEGIGYNRASRDSWRYYLRAFIDEVYPECFEPFGISLETALLLSELNGVRNAMQNLAIDDDDDDEPWKKGKRL
jgi:hypothetical protein